MHPVTQILVAGALPPLPGLSLPDPHAVSFGARACAGSPFSPPCELRRRNCNLTFTEEKKCNSEVKNFRSQSQWPEPEVDSRAFLLRACIASACPGAGRRLHGCGFRRAGNPGAHLNQGPGSRNVCLTASPPARPTRPGLS